MFKALKSIYQCHDKIKFDFKKEKKIQTIDFEIIII